MSNIPLVSVLVTVYNRERYLADCLNSILLSTMQDFEVVVVDDGSKDRSVEIAEDFARRDPRIRLFRNLKNLGDYPNRNRAAELAVGKWLKYVDSDDMIQPDCLTKMLAASEQFPEAVLLLSYPRPANTPRPLLLNPLESWQQHFLQKQGFFCSGPLLSLIRADAFRAIGGFRGSARNMGDSILWMELCRRWPLVIVEPDLTFWRQHDGQEYQLVRDGGWDNVKTHCLLTQVLLRDFLGLDCPLSLPDRRRVRRELHWNNLRRLAWHLRHGRVPALFHELQWAIRCIIGQWTSDVSK
jgi:glycosyltransferase involved in cell wall biosynthesis